MFRQGSFMQSRPLHPIEQAPYIGRLQGLLDEASGEPLGGRGQPSCASRRDDDDRDLREMDDDAGERAGRRHAFLHQPHARWTGSGFGQHDAYVMVRSSAFQQWHARSRARPACGRDGTG
jgi:hypothetical protein